jgi:hypothetical protein
MVIQKRILVLETLVLVSTYDALAFRVENENEFVIFEKRYVKVNINICSLHCSSRGFVNVKCFKEYLKLFFINKLLYIIVLLGVIFKAHVAL